MKFGDNLRNLRKINKISQEKLAEKLDVSRQSVSKWETGESYPEMKHILKICEIFHCKINDLVHESFSDFKTMDQDVQDNVVKFKKDKQERMQLLSKVMQVIAKIWMISSIISLVSCFISFLQVPSILKETVNVEEFLSELSMLAEYEWMVNLNYSNLLIFVEIVLVYGMIIGGLHWFLASNLDKLFKNLHGEKTPFMLENISKIKRIGLFFVLIRFIDILFHSILKSIGTKQIIFDFDIMDIALVIIVILGIYIFEYGYEIQLDSKGVIFDEEENVETTNNGPIPYLNKNIFKIATRLFVIVIFVIIFGVGFMISKNIYEQIINQDPSDKIQVDAIITMEELGYKETDIDTSSISNYDGVDHYTIIMDNSTKMIYDEEYMGLYIWIHRHPNKEDALKDFLSRMTNNKRYSISNACNKLNPCTFEDTKYITTNNIHEYMIELDVDKWNVEKGYVLYNKDNYKEGSGEANEYFLLKGNTFIEIRLNTPLEFNEEQIKVLSTLFERSEEIFKK